MPYLALYLLALSSVVVMAPGATVYWDAFGYVLQAINGDVGGLGLGRPVFAMATHALARAWLALGGSPWNVEILLRVACAIAASAAAPLTMRLALDCGASRRAAWMAGLAVAVSPAAAHASGQVLTDGPGAALLVLACVCGVRATVTTRRSTALGLGAGVVLGLAVGVREQTLLNAVTLAWFVWLAPRPERWRLGLAMAAGFVAALTLPLVFVLLTQPAYVATVRAWIVNMTRDRMVKTYGWRDLAVYLAWLLSLGPVVVIAGGLGIAATIRSRRWRWPLLTAMAAPALLQVAWLATFRGVGYSPRLLIGALPVAFAIPAAVAVTEWAGNSVGRWRMALAGWILPLLLAAPVAHFQSAELTATLRDWPSRLRALPADAVVVTGQPCPAIPLVRAIVTLDSGAALLDGPALSPSNLRTLETPRSAWEPVCPGWAWPSNLEERLNRALGERHVVAADLRGSSWTGAEQRAARDELERYVRAHPIAEISGQLIVWRDEPR
ncbi:MAG: phospholipid carrier-dependent glycosyltransferase [Acidobacteriota bacterium]